MSTTDTLRHQYALATGARAALFTYCEDLSTEDFVQQIPSFGHGSIRHLLVHVANVYQYWIGHNALQQNQAFFKADDVVTMLDIPPLYRQVDKMMDAFFTQFDGRWNDILTIPIQSRQKEIVSTALAIFTHVATHEFHHKGQVLSMSRHLGYTPVDTDLIRF